MKIFDFFFQPLTRIKHFVYKAVTTDGCALNHSKSLQIYFFCVSVKQKRLSERRRQETKYKWVNILTKSWSITVITRELWGWVASWNTSPPAFVFSYMNPLPKLLMSRIGLWTPLPCTTVSFIKASRNLSWESLCVTWKKTRPEIEQSIYNWYSFRHFWTREITFGTSCLLSCKEVSKSKQSGHSWSKLTMSLVTVSLKLWSLMWHIR